ncbi:MAG: four helix bundle protein [Ignavibacteria bacterium]|nr:four helix bundle protein [Ignavibacteria bacterium]
MKSDYTDLDVWKKCRLPVNNIYDLTKKFPKEELYSLTNQLRRCAISIPSNIAEGCGRQHVNDSLQFFYFARGSLYELETQLFLSRDQNYIAEEELNIFLNLILECKKLLNGFIKYYKSLK